MDKIKLLSIVLSVALGALGEYEIGKQPNVVIDTVHKLEPRATCVAGFSSATYHSAVCEMPDRSQVQCIAGEGVKGGRGETLGWSCALIYNPPATPAAEKPLAKAPAQPSVPSPAPAATPAAPPSDAPLADPKKAP